MCVHWLIWLWILHSLQEFLSGLRFWNNTNFGYENFYFSSLQFTWIWRKAILRKSKKMRKTKKKSPHNLRVDRDADFNVGRVFTKLLRLWAQFYLKLKIFVKVPNFTWSEYWCSCISKNHRWSLSRCFHFHWNIYS